MQASGAITRKGSNKDSHFETRSVRGCNLISTNHRSWNYPVSGVAWQESGWCWWWSRVVSSCQRERASTRLCLVPRWWGPSTEKYEAPSRNSVTHTCLAWRHTWVCNTPPWSRTTPAFRHPPHRCSTGPPWDLPPPSDPCVLNHCQICAKWREWCQKSGSNTSNVCFHSSPRNTKIVSIWISMCPTPVSCGREC